MASFLKVLQMVLIVPAGAIYGWLHYLLATDSWLQYLLVLQEESIQATSQAIGMSSRGTYLRKHQCVTVKVNLYSDSVKKNNNKYKNKNMEYRNLDLAVNIDGLLQQKHAKHRIKENQ